MRILNRYGRFENIEKSIFENYIQEIKNVVNESSPYIQFLMEGIIERFRKDISSYMYESIAMVNSPKNMKKDIEDIFKLNFRLIRDIYFLGNGDLFSQFDNALFEARTDYYNNDLNISEQFEFVVNLWKEIAIINYIKSNNLNLSNCTLNICCDTFDLFNFNIADSELIEMVNCRLIDNCILIFDEKYNSEKNDVEVLVDENEETKDIYDEEDLKVASLCKIKWPIRIIDGFNHVLECISSINVISSLLFTKNGASFINDQFSISQQEFENNCEFLRFTWFFKFKDESKNVIEFYIKLYWHTKNLKLLLNTDKDYSLLKANVINLTNSSMNKKETDLFSYRLRVLFKQSNITLYMEPLKNLKMESNSLFNKPTQILNIQHINIDICLPLAASACNIYFIRHYNVEKLERKLQLIKWCHISALNNNDVISQLSYSNSSKSTSSYNFNLLNNKPLNNYISGINFENHIFRLRIVPKFDWPLPLLFTKMNMEQYYNLFDFYWLFYRTYNSLERVWKECFNLRYGNRRTTFFSFSREFPINHFWNYIFYCRWVLQITIGEFYTFLQHFSIAQSFDKFFEVISKEHDFENIIFKHNELIQTIIIKSGFMLPSILSPLTTILILTNEWSYSIYDEISRWNRICDINDSQDIFSQDKYNIPWKTTEWYEIVHNTTKFMNNFILLWDNLCSEISIISNNIQYQHFNYLLSIFCNNRWNIDIPDFNYNEQSYIKNLAPPSRSNLFDPETMENEYQDDFEELNTYRSYSEDFEENDLFDNDSNESYFYDKDLSDNENEVSPLDRDYQVYMNDENINYSDNLVKGFKDMSINKYSSKSLVSNQLKYKNIF